jgi:hypothetical protein
MRRRQSRPTPGHYQCKRDHEAGNPDQHRRNEPARHGSDRTVAPGYEPEGAEAGDERSQTECEECPGNGHTHDRSKGESDRSAESGYQEKAKLQEAPLSRNARASV